MDRYTRQDAVNAFDQLAKALGKPLQPDSGGDWQWQVGAWSLDYSPHGGYQIVQVCNNRGAVSEPLGSRRRSAKEFCIAVHFALDVLRVQADDNRPVGRRAALATLL